MVWDSVLWKPRKHDLKTQEMSRFKRTFEIAPKADKKYEVRKILKAQKYLLSSMEQLETF